MSYVLPLGPYHPALEEPVHVKLLTEGEIIKDSEVYIGYNHRGIEKLTETRNFIQTITLVERVCGICSHSHAMTYCLAIEDIAGMEVPKRGQYIRVILSELERLHSHYLWLGLAAHIIAFDSLFMMCFASREKIMDMLEVISGNRVNYAMNIVGGARRDINEEQKQTLINMISELRREYKNIYNIYAKDSSIAARTKGVGVLSKDDALNYGACGPHGRASGVNFDVRKTMSYNFYEDFEFNVALAKDGDVFSRAVVRLIEIEESFKIIEQALNKIPHGPINLGNKIPRVPAGEAMIVTEAPRGEVTYYVVTNGGQTNGRVNIHVPTFKNAMTVPVMLKNNTIADAGLIVASIDPCFSRLDR